MGVEVGLERFFWFWFGSRAACLEPMWWELIAKMLAASSTTHAPRLCSVAMV